MAERVKVRKVVKKLPRARGVRGHLQYTWAVLTRMTEARKRLKIIDNRLTQAVEHRDKSLHNLGEVTLKLAEKLPPERKWPGLEAFEATIAALKAEHLSTRERETMMVAAIEKAQLEGEAAMESSQERRRAIKEEIVPHRGSLVELKRQSNALEASKERKTLMLNDHRDQLARMKTRAEDPQAGPATKEGQMALLEEISEMESIIDEMDDDLHTLDAEMEANAQQLEAEQSRVNEIEARLKSLDQDERAQRKAFEARLAEMRTTLKEITRKAGRIEDRTRAARVDLAREVLQLERPPVELKVNLAQATMAFTTCEQVTRARDRIQTEWVELDIAPVKRTLFWMGMVIIIVFALIIVF